jgi:hypothetical protein
MLAEVVRQAWQRSEGKCQCTLLDHNHPYVRCNKPLVWNKQDKPYTSGWRVHHRLSYGKNAVATCEILCWECYQKVTQNPKKPR